MLLNRRQNRGDLQMFPLRTSRSTLVAETNQKLTVIFRIKLESLCSTNKIWLYVTFPLSDPIKIICQHLRHKLASYMDLNGGY